MINQLEASMRPGKLSMRGFLGPEEKLDEVLKADDETVKNLGLTHEQIADRLEYFVKEVPYPPYKGTIVDNKFRVTGLVSKGMQECPWEIIILPHGNKDYSITNTDTNEVLIFPGGIVHLIREHHFYEGKQSPYRVDPERIAKVLEMDVRK